MLNDLETHCNLRRGYISSGASTSLTKSLNGMHKAIATKAYLHLNDCYLYNCLAYEGAHKHHDCEQSESTKLYKGVTLTLSSM